MNEFRPLEELRIGKITEVNGTGIRVEIDPNIVDLMKIYNGKVYPIGQISSIIKINFGRKILFAYVKMLRMKSDLVNENNQFIKPSEDTRIIDADLFSEGNWSQSTRKLIFNNGIEAYPLPLQSVYIMTQSELDILYESAEKSSDSSVFPYVSIGKYVGSNQSCTINIDKLFGHHCAILGSTGSGKSGTVTSIIHSILEYSYKDKVLKPNIILIDPHGEYGKPFLNVATLYRAYSLINGDDLQFKELVLPYWMMTSNELRELVIGKTEHEATSQNNIIYEAIGYARMVQAGIVNRYEDEPNGRQLLSYCEGKSEGDMLNFDRDKPIPFSLFDFEFHIDKVQGRKVGKKDSLSASDRKDIDSILRKLKSLQTNPQLNYLMNEYNHDVTLKDVLGQFLGVKEDNKCLSIIDISGIPNEVAGILTALISRLLFQFKLWQTHDERKANPVVLVCEEAHRYVPNGGEVQYKEAQNAIRRIAKEGRKYGIGLMLVSQRPSDVESTVLSQCNTWIILRLSNSNDQSYVGSFMPDNSNGLLKGISSLKRCEAVVVGEAIALPSRIKIRELSPEQLPDSADISFVNGWSVIQQDDAGAYEIEKDDNTHEHNGATEVDEAAMTREDVINDAILRWTKI